MTLQRKVFEHTFGERWQQVGVRINYLNFPPRTAGNGDTLHTFHSKKTGIAYLKGWAAAEEFANRKS